MKDRLNALMSRLWKAKRGRVLALLTALFITSILSIPAPEKPWVDKDLPALNNLRPVTDTSPKLPAIVQLYRKGQFYCTAFVIGNNYALTASHCIVDDEWNKTDEEIEIRLNNKPTGIKAKAAGVYVRRDLGLLKGDFSKFDYVMVENDEPGVAQVLLTCGYPGGNKHVMCTRFFPQINDGFGLKGVGFLQPGMSGGPVFNPETHKAVGVNTLAYPAQGEGGGVGISSLTGVLGIFGIEP